MNQGTFIYIYIYKYIRMLNHTVVVVIIIIIRDRGLFDTSGAKALADIFRIC